jgi:hypothetical protein
MSLQSEPRDDDPGTAWHPKRWLKRIRDLPDLDDEEVAEHRRKPEAADQPDSRRVMEAED